MPRKNRPHELGRHVASRRVGTGSRGPIRDEDPPPLRLSGGARLEVRAGREWHVQPISSLQAQKDYRCPGCGGEIEAGVAHLVAWRADGVLGDAADLAARRHWHVHCWRAA